MRQQHGHESRSQRSEAPLAHLLAGTRRSPRRLLSLGAMRAATVAAAAMLVVLLGMPQIASATGSVVSTTTITSTTPSPVVGQPIEVDVSVTGADSGTPTGTVAVSDGVSGSCNA
ncbi:MAG: Ig-like domain-containing protein, partial [Acidimicrobiales bacterium]